MVELESARAVAYAARPMARRRPSTQALAARTWRRLFGFFMSTRAQRDAVLKRHALTPNDIRALTSLTGREGRTMRSLAEEWGCDASNATWIVDRLERRGLAERRADASDRRVKLVALTRSGAELRSRVMLEMSEPPRELLSASPEKLAALHAALAALTAPAPRK